MNPVDDNLAQEIASTAVELARGAGEILASYFGRPMDIEFKDKDQRDPVTAADKASQDFLVREIARKFPDHGILGEEGEEGKDEADTSSPDFLWVLDPLDGTTNFLNGFPVYASSIGVMHRGWPLAGAIYLPWPKPSGGFVLHCRRNAGCFADDEPISVYESQEPGNNRLIALPGSFGSTTRFSRNLRGKIGEPRTTGSIAYELAMTACGVLQYSVIGAPRLWDVAGGALAVLEAKGEVMTRFRGEKAWHPLGSLVPSWETAPPSFKDLRQWVAPLVAGNRQVAPLIANNLRPRFRPAAKLRSLTRRLLPGRKSR